LAPHASGLLRGTGTNTEPPAAHDEWIEPPVDPDEDGQVAQTLDMAQVFLDRLFDNPALAADIPDGASVVFLPDHDPALAAANRAPGEAMLAAGATAFFARIP
jgi:hypothetical protein